MNSMNLAISALTILLAVAFNQTKPSVAVSHQRSAISQTEPGTAGSDETNPTPPNTEPLCPERSPVRALYPGVTPTHDPCPEGATVCSQGRKPLENIALSVSWSPEGATEPASNAPTISENQTKPNVAISDQRSAVSQTEPGTAGFDETNPTSLPASRASGADETNPLPPSRPSTDSSLITHHSSLSSFTALDIYIDPAGSPLAAYQIELLADPTQVKIVGIEGGSHPAFTEPPYYDPAAMMNHRVIIAAFNTGKDLPTARTRVATIHIRITGDAKPSYQAKLQTAGDPEGKTLAPAVTVEERKQTTTNPGQAGTRESNDTRTPTTQQGAKE